MDVRVVYVPGVSRYIRLGLLDFFSILRMLKRLAYIANRCVLGLHAPFVLYPTDTRYIVL